MALSNWDTLSVNEKGEPTNGVLKSPLGVWVEIYKNWLYVHDPVGWQEGGSYVEDTVMGIQKGDLTYKDLHINAIRGPQQGIYCIVNYSNYPPRVTEACPCGAEKGALWHERSCAHYIGIEEVIMIGCGVYAYNGDECVGVMKSSTEYLQNWISGSVPRVTELPMYPGKTPEQVLQIHQSYFQEEGEEVFLENGKLLLRFKDYAFPLAIRQVKIEEALRFNQGDAYFAKQAGVDVVATPPGEAEDPFFMQVMKQLKK